MTAPTAQPHVAAPAAIPVPGWARIAVGLSALANLLVLGFISFPVIGFFFMSFNGWGTPTSIGAKLVFALVMFLAAALPIASIVYGFRFLKRGRIGLALATALCVPVLGGFLFATYGMKPAPPASVSAPAPEGVAP